MAGGDHTLLGPYDNNAVGLAAAALAMNNAWVHASDTYSVVMDAGNIKFYVIHIAGG